MIDKLSEFFATGKNEILPPSNREILISNKAAKEDNNTMVIFKSNNTENKLPVLCKVFGEEESVEEKKDIDKEKSVWSKFKNFMKEKGGYAILGAAASMGVLGISIYALACGTVISFGLTGVIFGLLSSLYFLDSYFSNKDNKKYYSEMKELTINKSHEEDKKALDNTVSKKVNASISSKEFVTFKTKNGALTQKLKMPMALDMNKILEKYSDEQSPEISEKEQKDFWTDIDKFFNILKEKTNNSIVLSEYSFGKYNIPDSLKELEKIKSNIQELIEKATDAKSSSGKVIDKDELIKLRQQIFLELNR